MCFLRNYLDLLKNGQTLIFKFDLPNGGKVLFHRNELLTFLKASDFDFTRVSRIYNGQNLLAEFKFRESLQLSSSAECAIAKDLINEYHHVRFEEIIRRTNTLNDLADSICDDISYTISGI